MTQEDINSEALLSFLAAVAMTIRRVEEEQPAPGFRDVFMTMLNKHLEGAIAGDAVKELDTRETIQTLGEMLSGFLVAGDIADATRERGESSESAD